MFSSKLWSVFTATKHLQKTAIFEVRNLPKRSTEITAVVLRSYCSNTPHIVQMRGLDSDTTEKDIMDFFRTLGIIPKAVHLKFDGSGRVSGMSEVEFGTHAEAVVAMRKKNAFLGNRFIRLTLRSTDADPIKREDESINKNHPETSYIAQKHSPEFNITENISSSLYHTGHIITMTNAPRRITEQAIYEFFWPVGASPISVKAQYNEKGIRTGEFEIQFLTKNDAVRAMIKNNAFLGNKFVELSLVQQ